jgi:glucan 1,3-beta-glucosidase
MSAKYNMKVLMDVHAMKDSQNGYDNSGRASDYNWTSPTNFTHWPIQAARWMGDWDRDTWSYKHINFQGFSWGLRVHEALLQRWGAHSAFYAFEPINEPQFNPLIDQLQDWYRASRRMVQKYTANAWFVMHNAGNNDFELWNNMFRDDDMDQVAVDVHHYQAFMGAPNFVTTKDSCDEYETSISAIVDKLKYPAWLGEWSLATDVCAWWLGGFNDANTHAQYNCSLIPCPYSYMEHNYGGDFNRSAPILGPFGPEEFVHQANVHNGMCTSDSNYFDRTQIQTIARCALDTFDRHLAVQMMWTAHNEIEAKWDYVSAWDLGWINTTVVPHNQSLDFNNITGQAMWQNGTIVTRAWNKSAIPPNGAPKAGNPILDFIQ